MSLKRRQRALRKVRERQPYELAEQYFEDLANPKFDFQVSKIYAMLSQAYSHASAIIDVTAESPLLSAFQPKNPDRLLKERRIIPS